ncbi:MAG: cyclopropane-fatty-acyl-phospholipid synthase family protein [Candidatus Bathyarchaeia archaeon]
MYLGRNSIAPFVASPMPVVRKMLEYAELKPGETLYDLGSGDGRIVIMAAQEFGAKGVGIELNKRLLNEAIRKGEELQLGERVKFIHDNLFNVDLSPADVVTMYLTTGANEKVKPKMERELRTDARVVTHDFSIPGWEEAKNLRFREEYRTHTIFLYRWRP